MKETCIAGVFSFIVFSAIASGQDRSVESEEDERMRHWAWQPISINENKLPESGENPIDGFVWAKLREKNLKMSPEANRPTLIRRLSFDLHGLPPSPEAVEGYVNDPASDSTAYENLVDQMLASPHFGERFARHWLDIAHYADTHGFERDKRRNHAWRYRDYVIEAFNSDKRYDLFLQEQIAGDVLWPEDEQAVVATGFLAAGPWDFVGQVETKSPAQRRAARSLDLDDMATQVMTSTMAMTVNCAKCHDHKLDPITQKEYYQLRAVFTGVKRDNRSIGAGTKALLAAARAQLSQEINRLEPGLDLADIVGGGNGEGTGNLDRGIDPRTGKAETKRLGYLDKVEANRFVPCDNRFIDGVFIPKGEGGKANIPVSSTGITVTDISGADSKAWDMIRNGPVNSQHSPELGGVHFADGSKSLLGLHANAGITFDLAEFRDAIGEKALRFSAQVGYFGQENGKAFADVRVFVDGKMVAEFRKLKRADHLTDINVLIPASARFLILMATDGGNGISMDQIGFGNPRLKSASAALTGAQRKRLAELQAERLDLTGKMATLGEGKVFAVLPAGKTPPPVRILRRGESESPIGDPVPPGAFAALAMLQPNLGGHQLSESERRAALARWITDRKNPLMPRVIVNRLWHWHFGQGIVDTPSDLGLGGGRPSHPELLDWLAAEMPRQNWSLKAMHRLMVTSDAYKQESRSSKANRRGAAIDASNRLLWRQNPRRIEAEAVRDAVLFVSGKLNPKRGGPGFEDFKYQEAYAPIYTYVTADRPALWRRSIYRYIVRTTPDRFLTTLDCPDPANLTPKRLTTTTPLQSLALYNNEFMLRQARYFAQRVEKEGEASLAKRVTRGFELAFGRKPSDRELDLGIGFVEQHGLFAFCRSLFNVNEFVYVD